MIATGMEMAAAVLRDGKKAEKLQYMPRHLMIDVDLVTPANAKQYYFPKSVY
jgi:ribose transport system substrate-binding protein